MDASGSQDANRAYYDAFSHGYEAHRGDNDPDGYHNLVDELEADFVRRYATGLDVLEVGCGTGLVLQRINQFARSAKGVDLSPGMLKRAEERGLDVRLGSATDLPFEDETFDVVCSFKVLSHVPDIALALREMARVTRRGGVILPEFYNPFSLRGLVKRYGPSGRIADDAHEGHVYTRFDSPAAVARLLPPDVELIDSRGIRIVTPAAFVMKHPRARGLFRTAERLLCDSPLRRFGGFWIAAAVKK